MSPTIFVLLCFTIMLWWFCAGWRWKW